MSNANAALGCMIAVPMIIYYSKALRIEGRDQFDTMVKIKHRSLFWERGNEFSKALTGYLQDSILEERSKEIEGTEETLTKNVVNQPARPDDTSSSRWRSMMMRWKKEQ